jgi:hypothetical protein
MATVNYSVPDDVKAEFDKAFGDQNKSAVIADLMRGAVREQHLQKRRARLFRELTNARQRRTAAKGAEIRAARTQSRT